MQKCKNCSEELVGNFCSNCGQSIKLDRVSVNSIATPKDTLTSTLETTQKALLNVVYPNPTSDLVTIEWRSENEDVEIRVSDLLGKELYSCVHLKPTGSQSLSLPNDGIFLITIVSGNQINTSKIVKISP